MLPHYLGRALSVMRCRSLSLFPKRIHGVHANHYHRQLRLIRPIEVEFFSLGMSPATRYLQKLVVPQCVQVLSIYSSKRVDSYAALASSQRRATSLIVCRPSWNKNEVQEIQRHFDALKHLKLFAPGSLGAGLLRGMVSPATHA